jgi:hypothetical protein
MGQTHGVIAPNNSPLFILPKPPNVRQENLPRLSYPSSDSSGTASSAAAVTFRLAEDSVTVAELAELLLDDVIFNLFPK